MLRRAAEVEGLVVRADPTDLAVPVVLAAAEVARKARVTTAS